MDTIIQTSIFKSRYSLDTESASKQRPERSDGHMHHGWQRARSSHYDIRDPPRTTS